MTPKSRLHLFLRFTGWIVIFPLLIGVVTLLIAMFEGRKADRLAEGGLVARATITDKDISVTYDSDGDRQTTYYLYFRFDHEGRTIEDRDSVSRGFFDQATVGQTLPLRYWWQDPGVNEIEPGSTATTILVTKIMSVVALVAAGFWGERCWRKAARAIRVRERGVRRLAKVTGHIKTGVRVNKVPRWRLAWRDEAGSEGQSFWLPEPRLGQFPIGTELTVYADPSGRLPAVWEHDVGPARGTRAVRR